VLLVIADFERVNTDHTNQENPIIVAGDSGIFIGDAGDISDALNVCISKQGLMLEEDDLAKEFFDLRTGLLGELFQKFTNYRVRVAIVLPAPEVYGERVSELAREHASHDLIRIVKSRNEAMAWLSS
jgi:hypothetical protein